MVGGRMEANQVTQQVGAESRLNTGHLTQTPTLCTVSHNLECEPGEIRKTHAGLSFETQAAAWIAWGCPRMEEKDDTSSQ